MTKKAFESALPAKTWLREIVDRIDDRFRNLSTGVSLPDSDVISFANPGVAYMGAPICSGRSALMASLAIRNSVTVGNPTLFISLASSKYRVASLLLSQIMAVPDYKIANGDLTTQDWSKLTKAVMKLKSSPLYVSELVLAKKRC